MLLFKILGYYDNVAVVKLYKNMEHLEHFRTTCYLLIKMKNCRIAKELYFMKRKQSFGPI